MSRTEGARDPARHLRTLRESNGLSRAQLAKASGVSRRAIAAVEGGRASLSDSDLAAVATALGVDPSELVPPGHFLELAPSAAPGEPRRGDAALDTLLREYLSMVIELRGSAEGLRSSVRHEDLKELARALGGTPEVIEAKVMDLLATGHDEASDIVSAIMPSYDRESTSPDSP